LFQFFQGFPGFNFGDGGFHLSFGIGAFPFGFLTSFNFSDRPHGGKYKIIDSFLGSHFQ